METPGIGHNNPPTDEELLLDELDSAMFAHRQRAAELAASCERAPEAVFDLETATKSILLAAQIGAFLSKVEAERKDRKDPILKHAATIDGFFKALVGDLEASRDAVLERIADYQTVIAEGPDDKAQIRTDEGPLATSSITRTVRIIGPDKVPSHFRTIDVAAVRAAVKAGETDIPGVAIVETRKALIK
ncbi:hypothetical protein [Azospirillum sp. TSH64]|uniref:hypothetical protein n=1 Tax=Azospirillum sp. TSH64 TaxID=652740 RepID=UPI000D6034B5|nr:hypothetical protein [Azospirillum sp. TSH64]PWC81282.1 hypothetical protein TSH64_01185 [Azospirillum sp. TSH64]